MNKRNKRFIRRDDKIRNRGRTRRKIQAMITGNGRRRRRRRRRKGRRRRKRRLWMECAQLLQTVRRGNIVNDGGCLSEGPSCTPNIPLFQQTLGAINICFNLMGGNRRGERGQTRITGGINRVSGRRG
jgi:hypothetical protein